MKRSANRSLFINAAMKRTLGKTVLLAIAVAKTAEDSIWGLIFDSSAREVVTAMLDARPHRMPVSVRPLSAPRMRMRM